MKYYIIGKMLMNFSSHASKDILKTMSTRLLIIHICIIRIVRLSIENKNEK